MRVELAGGIPGRSISWVVTRFLRDVEVATENDTEIPGIKLDLSEAFDMARFEDTSELLSKIGAPRRLMNVVRCFDEGQIRFVEHAGAVDARPIIPRRGIPQGCLISPVRMAVIMAVWTYVMHKRHPDCAVGVFVDDRILWQHDSTRFKEAMTTNKELEDAFSLADNFKKRVLFANKAGVRKRLGVSHPSSSVAH